MATTSDQASTMSSAMRNTWMLIQNPFSNECHPEPSVRIDHAKNTLRTLPLLVNSNHTMNAMAYTVRPTPTEYHAQSRAFSPSSRAGSISPRSARRPARSE